MVKGYSTITNNFKGGEGQVKKPRIEVFNYNDIEGQTRFK